MYRILSNFEEQLCENLNEDEYFNGINKIYLDLVVTKDSNILIIPNKYMLSKPILDLEIKGFEAVIIPTGDFIYNTAPNISVESIKKVIPNESKINKLILNSRELVEKLTGIKFENNLHYDIKN